MRTLMVADESLRLVAQVPLYQSLQMERRFFGVGDFSLTLSPAAPGAGELLPGRIIWPQGESDKAMLVEDITRTRDVLTVTGCQLKGLARRRLTIPPLALPSALWQYTSLGWREVTDAAEKRQALQAGHIRQGYERPAALAEGEYWLDLTAQAAVYDWGSSAGVGAVWAAQDTALARDKYRDFGWDRFTAPAESVLLHYAALNLVQPEEPARAIPGLRLAADEQRGDTLAWQARFERLDGVLEAIGEKSGIGWDIVPDLAGGGMVLTACAGRDRSMGIGKAVLSLRAGNVEQMEEKQIASGAASAIYVGGAGEDENRLVLCEGGGVGLSRRESWADAGSVDDPSLLRLFGQQRLTALSGKHVLTAHLLDTGLCRYERDYALGDTVLLTAYGVQAAARLIAITELHESGRRRLSAVFGQAPVTVAAALARRGAAVR